MRFWCSTVTGTGCNSLVIPQRFPRDAPHSAATRSGSCITSNPETVRGRFFSCFAATATPSRGLVTAALLLVPAVALTSSWRTKGAEQPWGHLERCCPRPAHPLEHCSKSWPVPLWQQALPLARRQDPPAPTTLQNVHGTRLCAPWRVHSMLDSPW